MTEETEFNLQEEIIKMAENEAINNNGKKEVSELSEVSIREKDRTVLDPLTFLKKGSDLQTLKCSVNWVVDGLIPEQSIILFHGRGGIGKTWLSLLMANAISRGLPFMGLSVKGMPVIYIDFENPLPVLVERVKKIGAEDVFFWHSTNEIMRPPKLDKPEWAHLKKLPIGLIIIDTHRAAQSKDENDSQHMAFVMSRLKELRDMGFTILLLHHTPKSNDRTYKGSTAILDLADHVLSLHKVRKTNPEGGEIEDEDDNNCFYRFGTKDKTRYEPYHIFLSFDKENGFVKASDPDEEYLQAIYELIEDKEHLNQKTIYDLIKDELDIRSKSKVINLLKKGEGKYWTSTRVKNAVYYEAKKTVRNSEYRGGTLGQFQNNSLKTVQTDNDNDATQLIDNTQVSKCPAIPQTVRTDEILEVIELSGGFE